MVLSFIALSMLAADETIIGGFNANQLKAWTIREGTKLESAHWPDVTPGTCGKLTFLKYTGKGEKWPAIILNMNPPMSWAFYEKLQFDVYAEEAMQLGVHFTSGGGGQDRHSGEDISLKAGMNHIALKINQLAGVNLNEVKQFHFFLEAPKKTTVVYIGEVSLVKGATVDIARQVNDACARIEKIAAAKLTSEQGKYIDEALKSALATAQKARKVQSAKISPDTLMALQRRGEKLERAYQQALLTLMPNAPDMSVYWASPMEKIHRTDQFFINMPTSVGYFDAARGESEGLQLAVYPRSDIDWTAVTIPENPRMDDGTELPRYAFQIAPVGYVDCPPPSYAVERSGLWPDPILTYAQKILLTKNCWQSWWIDLTVPKNQKPGLYTGRVVVSGGEGGAKKQIVKFQVKIRNFELKSGPPYPSVASVMPDGRCFDSRNASPEAIERWRNATFDLVLAHRGNPDSLYIGGKSPPTLPESAKYRIDRNAGLFNITSLHTDAPMDRIDVVVPLYRRAGILKNAFFYGFDEFPEAEFWRIKQSCKAIKAKYPEIPIFTTAYDHSFGTDKNNLNEYIDGWIPLTTEFIKNINTVRKVQKLGKKVWWYVCCGPNRPWANFFIENPALDSRLLTGVMFWKYRPDGMLYFAIDEWYEPAQKEYWDLRQESRKHAISGAPITNWSAQTTLKKWNGDGLMIYPAENGPIPSLRLKAYRDGMDDYIYFKMLSEALRNVTSGKAEMSESWRQKARSELKIEPELLESMTKFSDNPEILFAKRTRIADLLESYYSAGNLPVELPNYTIMTPLWNESE